MYVICIYNKCAKIRHLHLKHTFVTYVVLISNRFNIKPVHTVYVNTIHFIYGNSIHVFGIKVGSCTYLSSTFVHENNKDDIDLHSVCIMGHYQCSQGQKKHHANFIA